MTLRVNHARSTRTEAADAAREIAEQLPDDAVCTLVFCAASYDLRALADALAPLVPGTLLGCTTAGQIGASGYELGGVSAATLSSRWLRVTTHRVEPLDGDIAAAIEAIRADIAGELVDMDAGEHACGLFFVDGMSAMEERLTLELYRRLGLLQMVGGSAGDNLNFSATFVLDADGFHENAAVIGVFRTRHPFAFVRAQHHAETNVRLVVTDTDPARRIVRELNGMPAAEEYARVLGVDRSSFGADLFATHPVMMKLGGELHLRSVRRALPDGSLEFYCAVETGCVLRLGRSEDQVAQLRGAIERARVAVPDASVMLACDCVLRRLEFEAHNLDAEIGALLAGAGAVGFSTYGEQIGALHVNQTLVGVMIGAGHV